MWGHLSVRLGAVKAVRGLRMCSVGQHSPSLPESLVAPCLAPMGVCELYRLFFMSPSTFACIHSALYPPPFAKASEFAMTGFELRRERVSCKGSGYGERADE